VRVVKSVAHGDARQLRSAASSHSTQPTVTSVIQRATPALHYVSHGSLAQRGLPEKQPRTEQPQQQQQQHLQQWRPQRQQPARRCVLAHVAWPAAFGEEGCVRRCELNVCMYCNLHSLMHAHACDFYVHHFNRQLTIDQIRSDSKQHQLQQHVKIRYERSEQEGWHGMA
jgi:hypothetical protein